LGCAKYELFNYLEENKKMSSYLDSLIKESKDALIASIELCKNNSTQLTELVPLKLITGFYFKISSNFDF
jgi:hypothetical protein